MATYIALLRAVNVGGTGKLAMASFRALLEGLGYGRVQTYIQSGNAVFEAAAKADKVSAAITAALEKLLGAPVGVMIRTPEQIERVIARNPFAAEAAADGTKVHVAFLANLLSGPAGKDAEAAIAAIQAKYPQRRDRCVIDGDALYLHLPDGAAETKFSGKTLDKALGVAATARNWNTVLKLREMAKSRDKG